MANVLRRESLSVKFAGYDIASINRLPLKKLGALLRDYTDGTAPALAKMAKDHPEKAIVAQRIAQDLNGRIDVLLDLGLGYLALERSTPTLSPGELQRLRLATQVRSNLFGVVYVLDEPSAGLHPADTEALLSALAMLKASGNSLFVVEHDLDVIARADWIVDVGPAAGEQGRIHNLQWASRWTARCVRVSHAQNTSTLMLLSPLVRRASHLVGSAQQSDSQQSRQARCLFAPRYVYDSNRGIWLRQIQSDQSGSR
jgi:ABC-type protease/lipase transport system fused ATPase/permease subunit